jgi:hypothetical protein
MASDFGLYIGLLHLNLWIYNIVFYIAYVLYSSLPKAIITIIILSSMRLLRPVMDIT